MKALRISTIILGLAIIVFMIAPIASAQTPITDEWFKGRVTIKGFEIDDGGNIVGRASGGGTVYAHIAADVEGYTVTTCAEDFDADDTWHTVSNTISTAQIYGSLASGEIWDFFYGANGLQFDVGGIDNIYLWPMFQVKYTPKSVSFKSFTCGFYNEQDIPWQLGACTMSLKSVAIEKVPMRCQDL
jgi:hypothetical protein